MSVNKKCSVKGCVKLVPPAQKSNKCPRHRLVVFRSKHPLAYWWGNLKRRARERETAFSLTLSEYTAFARDTGYDKARGKSSLSLSINRIDSGLGYHSWNINVLTLRENSRKSFVPYFNGGVSKIQGHEYRSLEKEYRSQCERIAAGVMKTHAAGTPEFWEEYLKQKHKLFEHVS